jgi:enoyl-CoA hydratase/carnithine racemase
MRFLKTLVAFPKPLVAAVTGPAVGIGTTVLLHCDLAYAGEGAAFRMPFVNLGLCPEAGSSYLLPLVMGHVRASELLLLGEKFGAAQALACGIVNAVVPDADLDAHAMAKARQLAAQPPASVRLSKALIKGPHRDALVAAMTTEGGEFVQRLQSPEAIEAFTAFMEGRKPDFSKFA